MFASDNESRFVFGDRRRQNLRRGATVEARHVVGELAHDDGIATLVSADDVLRLSLEMLDVAVRAIVAWGAAVPLHLLEVLDEARPAREAGLAGDHVLRVGELQLVWLAITKRDGVHRAEAAQRFGVRGAHLLEQRLGLLALELEVRDAGHTTSFRRDPCPPRGSEKRLSCLGTYVRIGRDHPFPRTGGAPTAPVRESNTDRAVSLGDPT